MKYTVLFIFFSLTSFAQNKYSVGEDGSLFVKDTSYYNYKSVNYLGGEVIKMNDSIENCNDGVRENTTKIKSIDEAINQLEKLSISHESSKETNLVSTSTAILDEPSGNSILRWWDILPYVLLAFLSSIFLRSLKNKERDNIAENQELHQKITDIQGKLDVHTVDNDTKYIAFIEDYSKWKNEIKTPPQNPITPSEVDHSLPLKIVNEMNKMETNLSRMDASIRGHKQLSGAVKRMKDNLLANGYEVTEMLGKRYDEGMTITADFVTDESLGPDDSIISYVMKPQVLFKGRIIQKGHIRVSEK